MQAVAVRLDNTHLVLAVMAQAVRVVAVLAYITAQRDQAVQIQAAVVALDQLVVQAVLVL